jgi:hypothetical protein
MDILKINLFKKKNFGDILEEIYNNQREKSTQINSLIRDLKPLVKSTGDATLLVPLIKEYINAGIKNDDQLSKMAGIVQRAIAADNKEGGGEGGELLSEKEKQQLLDAYNESQE